MATSSEATPRGLNRDFRRLESTVTDGIRRGVTLQCALSGFGKHLRPAKNGGMAAQTSDYDLSTEVEFYDAFLSHDWYTSRMKKIVALLLTFNLQAAHPRLNQLWKHLEAR